jgi:hypothetical protein
MSIWLFYFYVALFKRRINIKMFPAASLKTPNISKIALKAASEFLFRLSFSLIG